MTTIESKISDRLSGASTGLLEKLIIPPLSRTRNLKSERARLAKAFNNVAQNEAGKALLGTIIALVGGSLAGGAKVPPLPDAEAGATVGLCIAAVSTVFHFAVRNPVKVKRDHITYQQEHLTKRLHEDDAEIVAAIDDFGERASAEERVVETMTVLAHYDQALPPRHKGRLARMFADAVVELGGKRAAEIAEAGSIPSPDSTDGPDVAPA